MTYAISKRIMGIILVMAIGIGCVAGQVTQRRGDKAYRAQDYTTAATEYTEAVASGNLNAMYHLGVMYMEGQGVSKDATKGATLVHQAAEAGLADAQLMYGLFSIYGDGVPMNPLEGIRWLTMAADQENDIAMYYLGTVYAMGLGVNTDIPTALLWMNKAKENGFPVEDALLTEQGLSTLSAD